MSNVVCFLIKFFYVFLIFFAFQFSLQANVVCMCLTTPVTFLEVIDGDTILVKRDENKVLVEFEGIDAPELDHEENKTQNCLHDQKIAEKAHNLIQDILLSANEVGLIIKEEINEQELRAQVYTDGLSVGQELLYKYLAVEGQGNWCGINEGN